MAITRAFCVTCDECGKKHYDEPGDQSLGEFRAFLGTVDGWEVEYWPFGGRELCPDCKQRKKEARQ